MSDFSRFISHKDFWKNAIFLKFRILYCKGVQGSFALRIFRICVDFECFLYFRM